MKRNSRFISLITITVTSVAIWITLSGFRSFIVDTPTLREEIRRYVSEQIFPVIKDQRNALDQHLSSEEKARIQEMRSKLNALQDERKSYLNDRNVAPSSEITPEMVEEIMERRKRHAKAHREVMMEVFEIVNRHEDEINQLLESIEDNMAVWMSDIREIHSEYKDQNDIGTGQGPYRGQGFRGRGMTSGYNEEDNIGIKGRGMGYGRGGRGLGGPGGLMGPGAGQGLGFSGRSKGFGPGRLMGFAFPLQPERFVLMDPDMIEKFLDKDLTHLPTLSPNPTNGMARIKLELDEAEHVSIDLFDRQGTEIRSLLDKTMDKGTHELIFDLSDLSQGLYFYHIHLENKVQKGRILIE
jgi:hypothetical protein